MIYHIKSEIQYNKKSFERRKPSLFSRISAIFCLNIFEESFLLQTLEHQSTIQLNFRCNFKSDSDFRSILSSIIHVWLVTWSSMPDHDPTDLLPYLNSIPSTCGYSNSWIWFCAAILMTRNVTGFAPTELNKIYFLDKHVAHSLSHTI